MEDTLVKRVLPHSIEAEQSVIGSMLMDRDAVIAASEILTADDFYQRQYGVMFGSMVELFNEGKPVDLVTLQDRLKEKDVPPEVCSLDFVRDIMDTVPTSANVRSYAQIVHDKAVLRRLIKINEGIANDCYAGKESLETIWRRMNDALGEPRRECFVRCHAKRIAERARETGEYPLSPETSCSLCKEIGFGTLPDYFRIATGKATTLKK